MQPWSALCAILIRLAGLMDVPGVRQGTASLATRVAGTVVPLLKQQPGEQVAHVQQHCSHGALHAMIVRVAGLVDVPGVRQEAASLATRVAGAAARSAHSPSSVPSASLIAVAGAIVAAMLMCR